MSKAKKRIRQGSKSLTNLTELEDSLKSNFDRGDRLYNSFGKVNKEGKPPQSYYDCKRKDYPVKEGFLCVQCLSDMKRTWKLRYVMLFHDKLCYMKPPKGSSCSMDFNDIHISDIMSVKINSGFQLLHTSDSDTFHVKTRQVKTLFRCRSGEERDKWMTALLTAKSADIMRERDSWCEDMDETDFTGICFNLGSAFRY